MAKFIRSGVFLPKCDYVPPTLMYGVTTDIRTVYYNILAESAGVVRYPAALGRAILAGGTTFNDVVLPAFPPIPYFAPVAKNIPQSVPTCALSRNQTLALAALNIRPGQPEPTSAASTILPGPPERTGTIAVAVAVATDRPVLINNIIKLGTGQGKTRLIGWIINTLGRKAIVVVNQISLVKQTVAELSALLPATSVGFYYGAKQKDGDIMVATHKSLCIAKLGGFKFGKTVVAYKDFAADIGTICYDEVHAYCTPKYWHLFEFGADNMIGFSATPENSPHILRAVAAVGPIVDIEKHPDFDRSVCNYTLTVNFIEYKAPAYIAGEERNGRLDYARLMTRIRADTARADMIVALCRRLIDTGGVIFVFSSVRDYAIKLRRMFECTPVDVPDLGVGDYTPGDSVLLIGDTAEARQDVIMAAARATARVIFTTYGYADTGLNISRANMCILAEPRNANMIQRTGRIMRADGSGEFRAVYDIIDVRTPLKSQYKKRIPAYVTRNAVFTTTRVSGAV